MTHETANDDGMRTMLRNAAKKRQPLHFLRLGGTRQFREEVINVTTADGMPTAAFQALLDPRTPSVEFVLADPRSESFLSRLDAELKDNREIWRVRRDVISFAKGLLNARRLQESAGQQPLVVAFHRKPLIWNLCISGSEEVVARAYFRAASGHDGALDDVVLSSGTSTRLAEAMFDYYKSVRDDETTFHLTNEFELESLYDWPSLFKGNATWLLHGEGNNSSVIKVLPEAETQFFESTWADSRHEEAKGCRFFNPVTLSENDVVDTDSYGGICIHLNAVTGVTAEKLLYEIQRLAVRRPEYRPKLNILANELVSQAVEALREFHGVWEQLGAARKLNNRMQVYPWRSQLTRALLEAGKFMTRDQPLLERCCAELEEIGQFLENESTSPFRDAHLKNRLVEFAASDFEENANRFVDWLEGISPESIPESLRTKTFDIDFETTRYFVTEWDDAWHILYSPNLGWKPSRILADGCRIFQNWWKRPDELHTAVTSLLGRSFRECCRRIWYANTMPNMFQQRYRTESSDHFLILARTSVERLAEYPHLSRLLQTCTDRFLEILPLGLARPTEEEFVVVADAPSQAVNLPAMKADVVTTTTNQVASQGLVFISSSSRDYSHAKRLNEYLRSKDIPTFFCEVSLPKCGDSDYGRQIDEALEQCRHMVVVTSASENVLTECVHFEWKFFVNEKRSGHKSGNLVTVVTEDITAHQLPAILRQFTVVQLGHEESSGLVSYLNSDSCRRLNDAGGPETEEITGSVFVSYRRDGGSETARLLCGELRSNAWKVFLDVDNLGSSHFDERLFTEIENADNFLLVLAEDSLEKCNRAGDWLREEIRHALQTKKNIVPVYCNNFQPPKPEELPSDIREVLRHNGVIYSHMYFNATIEKLLSFLNRKPSE